MVGIFTNRQGTSLPDWSKQLYRHWKVGARGQDNGVLITYFSDLNGAHVETGIGLDSIISPEKKTEIANSITHTGLIEGKLDAALLSGAYLLFKALQSPLIEAGRVDEILKHYQLEPALHPTSQWDAFFSTSWVFFFLIGIIAITLVMHHHLSKEAHFSATGWHKPSFIDVGLHRKIAFSHKKLRISKQHLNLLSPIITAIQKVEGTGRLQIHLYLTKRWFEKDLSKRASRLFHQFGLDGKTIDPTVFIYLNLKQGKIVLIGSPKISKGLEQNQNKIQSIFAENLRGTHFERAIALAILESQTFLSQALKA
jgi:hypothetical protein